MVRKGLPLPNLVTNDYVSANAGASDELIKMFTNSLPVNLSPGDWHLSAVNVSGGPASYAIRATEWPFTGLPIIITNSFVVSNSLCFTWTSLPGVNYHVEGLTNLNSTNLADPFAHHQRGGLLHDVVRPVTGGVPILPRRGVTGDNPPGHALNHCRRTGSVEGTCISWPCSRLQFRC